MLGELTRRAPYLLNGHDRISAVYSSLDPTIIS